MSLTFIKAEPKIDFIGMRKIFYALSVIVILAGVASLLIKGGPTYGIDFAGGAVVQVKFDKPVSDEQTKTALADVTRKLEKAQAAETAEPAAEEITSAADQPEEAATDAG